MERNINKKSLIIYSIIGVVLIGVILGYIVYSNNIEEDTELTEIAKLEEDASSISTEESSSIYDETENASSEIGKTIEEVEEELELSKKVEQYEEVEKEVKKEEKVINEVIDNNEKNDEETMTQNTEKIEITENKELKFIKPVQGEILNKFAKDNLIYSKTLCEWITHLGIDIKADKTSVVQASEEGTVKSIKTDPRYGLTVVISHTNGFETVYSNLLTAEFVVEGENVGKGQTIGTIGNSSSFESGEEYHLHFEMIKDGEYVDPERYIIE